MILKSISMHGLALEISLLCLVALSRRTHIQSTDQSASESVIVHAVTIVNYKLALTKSIAND